MSASPQEKDPYETAAKSPDRLEEGGVTHDIAIGEAADLYGDIAVAQGSSNRPPCRRQTLWLCNTCANSIANMQSLDTSSAVSSLATSSSSLSAVPSEPVSSSVSAVPLLNLVLCLSSSVTPSPVLPSMV